MTAAPVVARCRVPGVTADLSAIRHSDALLDLLAQRQLSRSLIQRDPALAVLSVLAADVDGPAAVSGAARRAAARRLAAWRARRLAVRQAERLAARQAQRLAARQAQRLGAGQRAERIAARHAELAARAALTREITLRARMAPPRRAGAVAHRGNSARFHPVSVAAIAGSALAAFVLLVVAAGSTGIVAAALLARLARLGTGIPGGSPGRGTGPRHGRPTYGPRAR